MRKNWIIIFVGIVYFASNNYNYAADFSANHSSIAFPVQPYLAEETNLLSFVSPFEMTAMSVGITYPAYSSTGGEVFRRFDWFSRIIPFVAEIKLETPFYEDKKAMGFDTAFYYRAAYNAWGIDTAGERGCCASFGAIDTLFTYKRKWPIYTKAGCLAGTVTGKTGPIFRFFARDTNTDIVYGPGIGWVVGAAVGGDYYFNQWVGCYFEFSFKYNNIFLNMNRSDLSHSFYITAFTIGLKTTF